MKTAYINFFFLIVLVAAVFWLAYFLFLPKESKGDFIYFPKSDFGVNIEIADEPNEWKEGLMWRESLAMDSGMLFVFPDEDFRSFWMKNTKINLDLIFISRSGRVVDLKENFFPCQKNPCETYLSKEKAAYVLEISAGLAKEKKVKIGDELKIQ